MIADFRIPRETGPVPAVAWLPPPASTPPPLVLLGHGGGSDKRHERITRLGRWFVTSAGFAAVAIDGPHHGERAAPPSAMDVVDGMVDDWRATVDHLARAGLADGDRLGYVGMSMGTRFGLPLIAALGPRFRVAVLGKFGLRADLPARFADDAARVTCPVLFHLQQDDTLFPPAGQRELFALLAGPGKELLTYPGAHGETDPSAEVRWREFVRAALSGEGAR